MNSQPQQSTGYRRSFSVLFFLAMAAVTVGQGFGPVWGIVGGGLALVLLGVALVMALRDRRAGRPEPELAERLKLAAFIQFGLACIYLVIASLSGPLETRVRGGLYVVLATIALIGALVAYLLARRAERAR